MSQIDELLRGFVTEFRDAGDADPSGYLRQVDGVERAELASLIDHFLANEPLPPFDPEAFAAFTADTTRSALVDELLESAPGLIALRRTSRLSKAEVAARLVEKLELPGQESGVKAAYHEIETGQVPPERVRSRVWEALAGLYGATTDHLRQAAQAGFTARAPNTSVAFTRLGDRPSQPLTSGRTSEPAAGDEAVRQAFFVD